jgi:hypothetical protein
MSWIHLVFYIIKLLPNPPNPIRQTVHKHPAPTIVGGKEHYEVEKVLDSMLIRRLEFLVSWKSYGYKENSWVSECDVSAPQLVSQFYREHPSAPHRIHAIHFRHLPFWPTHPLPA